MPDYELVNYRGVWCLYWRENGRPIRRSTGCKDKASALRVKAQVEKQDTESSKPFLQFSEMWERYRLHLGARPAGKTMLSEAKAVLPHFGELYVSQVNRDTCAAYIKRRHAQGRKDGTILTELNRVASTLGFAKKEGLIDDVPPMTFPRRPEPKSDYLTRAQFKHLLDCAMMPHTKLFLILAITTGARLQALTQLTWDRVDMTKRLIDLKKPGHTGKGRAVLPINNTLYDALLEAEKLSRCDFVLSWGGAPLRSVKRGLAQASSRAGLKTVTAHVLRHSAAVWMAEAGRPMSEIAQYLGHADDRITQRVYARYSPTYLRNSAAALEVV
jgi:integrase